MTVAKFETPDEAIFRKKFGKKSTPLFTNQKELAVAIIGNPDTGFAGKTSGTVRSALSQLFTGERSLSKSLKFALISTLRVRFDHTKFNFESFEKALLQQLNEIYRDRLQEKRVNAGDRDYDALIDATKNGSEFLVTTLEPAELHQSELADRLKDQLLEKTQILDGEKSDNNPATYRFFLPNDEDGAVAQQFWEALKSHIKVQTKLSEKEIDEKLIKANKEGIILTFSGPPELVMHPYIFIDISNKLNRKGFFVSYRDINIPSVAELSRKLLANLLVYLKPQLDELEKDIKNHYTIY